VELLKAVDLIVGDGSWMLGWDVNDRACGVRFNLVEDHCSPDETADYLIGSEGTVFPSPYHVSSFSVTSRLEPPLACLEGDEEAWLKTKVFESLDLPVGRAITRGILGSDAWIGNPDVKSESKGSGALGEPILAGRNRWMRNIFGLPMLHVSLDQILPLVKEQVIRWTEAGDLLTVWGDPVVFSAGYEPETLFWAGDIEVRVSAIDTDVLLRARENMSTIRAEMVVAVDMSPCSIVRIGDAYIRPVRFAPAPPVSRSVRVPQMPSAKSKVRRPASA
jgi:hypothetical protein